jgi:hypothetical protein
MSILRFLGVVDASGLLASQQSSPPPRQRKLAVEKLDSRALLTLIAPIVTDTFAELEEIVLPPEVQPEPSSGDPDPSTWEQESPSEPLPEPYAGSGDGTGGDPASDPSGDPPSEPITESSTGSAGGEGADPPLEPDPGSGGGSAGGEGGDPPPEPDPGSGGGSTGGEGQPPVDEDPVITSASYTRIGSLVIITGLVADDGPLGGLTVYFSSDDGLHFTTQTTVLGAFVSLSVFMDVGTQVSIYTIDSTGHQSDTMLLIV